jgi:hypothetical protein
LAKAGFLSSFSQPNKKLIFALVDGMYGSKTNETSLIKLQIVPITVLVLNLDKKMLPSRFDVLLLPELGVLKILVTQMRNLHGNLQAFFDFNSIKSLQVLFVSFINCFEEFCFQSSQLFLSNFWNLFFISRIGIFQGSVTKVS